MPDPCPISRKVNLSRQERVIPGALVAFMDRATRKAIVYALVLSYGEDDLAVLQKLSGIPRSTFYKVLNEVKSETSIETDIETMKSRIHPGSVRFLRQVLRPDAGIQLNMRQDFSVPMRPVGDLRDSQTYLSCPDPITETEGDMSTPRQGKAPVREWNPRTDHGKLVVYFAIVIHRVRGKEPSWPKGDVRIAFRNARSILDRGYTFDEGRGVVDYYVRLGRDITVSARVAEWIDGYPWTKFISNFDEYYDRGVRTNEIVIRVPDIDQQIIDWTAAVDQATEPQRESEWNLSPDELAWYKQNRTRKNGKAQSLRLTHYQKRLEVIDMLKDDPDNLRISSRANESLRAGRSLKAVLE